MGEAGLRSASFKLALAAAWLSIAAFGQSQNRQRIDVQDYAGDIRIDPKAQTLAATVTVHFLAIDDASSVSFELNNALSLEKVTDEQGRQIPASRLQENMSVRLTLPQPIPSGKPGALTFTYDGKLSGDEESPVFGIKFAAIHPDFAYLLYPARWFPVNEYTTDRFSSDLKITVPAGYKVLGSGVDSNEPAPDGMTTSRWRFSQASFPGSIAVVRNDAGNTISDAGVATTFYFRESAPMAGVYGQEFARAMTFFTDLFGIPPKRNLTVVETEAGAPNGYSAPGLIFLSPSGRGIGKDVNLKLVANQVARQWWEDEISPTTRNHLWIENGMARYSELLYIEHVNGAGAMETERHDVFIEALTVDKPPLIQSGRLEDYSPEYWAATAGKGAAVLQMLRDVMGDENFMKLLKTVPEKFAWKSINTDDFHAVAQDIHGQSLNYFFQQWVESSGSPQFKLSYTVLRVKNAMVSSSSDAQPGFRVMGKVTQDLDLFRMPVTLHIETNGNPEEKQIEVVGTSSEFSVDTFGQPRADGVTLDPKDKVLKFNDTTRVEVAIRKGEQHAEVNEFTEALQEYQKALDVLRNSSLAHYRIGELFFQQSNWTSAANAFHDSLTGDLTPKWTEVWSHIYLGRIYDISDQRPRALSEYQQALRSKDNSFNAQEEAQKGVDHPYQRQRTSSN